MFQNKNIFTVSVILIAIACFIAAWIYFTHTATKLPHYFPGYQFGYNHIHVKRGIIAVIIGLGCFIFAWFQTRKKSFIVSRELLKKED